MIGIFCVLGIGSGCLLTVFDVIMSTIGFAGLLPEQSISRMALPPVMATLALSMNALSPRISRMLTQDKEGSFALVLTWFVYIVCISFDFLSSLLGFLLEFTETTTMIDAIHSSRVPQIIAAFITAVFVTIGPFLTTLFFDLLKQSGGITGSLRGFFGGTN